MVAKASGGIDRIAKRGAAQKSEIRRIVVVLPTKLPLNVFMLKINVFRHWCFKILYFHVLLKAKSIVTKITLAF